MKAKFIVASIVLSLIACSASAQLKFGVLAGFTSSDTSVKGIESIARSNFHFGGAAKLSIPIVGLAIQPEILFQMKGVGFPGADDGQGTVSDIKANIGYVEVPVQIQYGADLVLARPYVFLEPFIGYGLFVNAKQETDSGVVKFNSFEKAGLERFEYGLGLGAGLDVWRFQLSAKYFWSFNNLSAGDVADFDAGSLAATIANTIKGKRSFNGISISAVYFF